LNLMNAYLAMLFSLMFNASRLANAIYTASTETVPY
jgi:hypothetical protein